MLLFCCRQVAVQVFLTHTRFGTLLGSWFWKEFGWYWWVFAWLLYSSLPIPSPALHSHTLFPAIFSLRIRFFLSRSTSYYYDCSNTVLNPLSTLKVSLNKRTRTRGGTFKFWNYFTLFQACLNKLLGLGFVCFSRTMKILHGEILLSRRKIAQRNWFL